MSLITGGGGASLGSVTSVTGTAASGQVPVASSSAASSWKYPPGFEINYTAITSPVNITDTSEATATALISPGAITFDGTAVLVQFFGVVTVESGAVADLATITLFEGSTQITRLAQQRSGSAVTDNIVALNGWYRFTPTAASHTYKVCAFVTDTTGTPAITAGNGGTAGYPPAFIRFTKV